MPDLFQQTLQIEFIEDQNSRRALKSDEECHVSFVKSDWSRPVASLVGRRGLEG